jgi:rod shape-determining protein MreD
MRVLVRVTIVLLSMAVLYCAVFAQLRIAGVAANVLLLVAIASGIAGGPERGAVVGFSAGLLYDLLLPTGPVGLSALTFCVVAYFVGRYQGTVVRAARWVTMAIAGLASAAAMVLYVAFGQLVNQTNMLQRRLWVVILVVAVINAVLAPLFVRLMRWAFDLSSRDLRPLLR